MTTGDRPWFTEVDYLTAHNPRGFLHSSCCDHPSGHGETFRQVMEGQGMTVRRYTMAEYRELRRPPTITPREAAVAQPGPVPPLGAVEVPPRGTRVTLPEHGEGTVINLLNGFEGTVALVVRTRRGEHLARTGGWTLTQERRDDVVALPEPLSPVVDAPALPPPVRLGAVMPSLFDL